MQNINLDQFKGKNISFIISKADELCKTGLEGIIHAHKIYNLALEEIPNSYDQKKFYILRGDLRQKIWNCERKFFWNERFFSQAGQDKIIKNHFFSDKKQGFFIEIGAYDGILGSNCYHFEKFQNWNGVAFEPSKIQFEKLKRNRSCKLINKPISEKQKEVDFFEVEQGLTMMSGIYDDNFISEKLIKNDPNSKFKTTKLLTTTFEENISHEIEIDYISIDIEGGELNVLKSIDFEKYSIKVISVENNSPDKNNFKSFFSEKNFKYFDRIGHDEIFFNKKYFNV